MCAWDQVPTPPAVKASFLVGINACTEWYRRLKSGVRIKAPAMIRHRTLRGVEQIEEVYIEELLCELLRGTQVSEKGGGIERCGGKIVDLI